MTGHWKGTNMKTISSQTKRPNQAKRVRLTITPDAVSVGAAYEEELRPVMTYGLQVPMVGSNGTLGAQLKAQPFYRIEGRKLKASPGLAVRIRNRLRSVGHRVKTDDRRRYADLFAPDRELVMRATGEERRWLKRACRFPRGTFQIRGNALEAAKSLHQLLPRMHTLLVVSTTRQAREIASRLDRELVDGAEVLGLQYPKRRFCVIESFRLNCLPYAPQMHWGTIIYLGIRAATSREAIRNAEFVPRARSYALVAGNGITGNQQLMLEYVAGPVIYRQSPYDRPTPNVRIELATPAGPPSQPLEDAFRWKQQNIWLNERRNRWIAEAATAFAAADLRPLRRLQLCNTDTSVDWKAYDGSLDTVVVVEAVAHARELERLLPGWTVRTAEPSQAAKLANLPATWDTYSQNRAIVTLKWLRRYGLAADVVIRADGTAVQWDERWGAHPDIAAGTGTFRLVDIQDDFDQYAIQYSASRRAVYAEYRWLAQPQSTHKSSALQTGPEKKSQRNKAPTTRTNTRPRTHGDEPMHR